MRLLICVICLLLNSGCAVTATNNYGPPPVPRVVERSLAADDSLPAPGELPESEGLESRYENPALRASPRP